MNATIYLLENPYLLSGMFAGQLPAVSVFFGFSYFLLRRITKIKTGSALTFAYFVSPALLLALAAWGLRAKDYGHGIQLLVPMLLSALSCAALYYHEWRRQSTESMFSQASQLEAVKPEDGIESTTVQVVRRRPQPQTETTTPNIENAAVEIRTTESRSDVQAEQKDTESRASWFHEQTSRDLTLPIVVLVAFILWIFSQSLGISSLWHKPNYIVEDGGAYGYRDTKKGAANKPLTLYRYAGIHNDKHQVYVEDDGGYIRLVLECAEPCKAIKFMSYWGSIALTVPSFRRNPQDLDSKRFIPADADSVESRVMEDAINGHLKVHGLNAAILNRYRVQIEKGMEGVPIRPVFSEGGIGFEYMAEGRRTETTTPANKTESNVDGQISNNSTLVTQDAPKEESSLSKTNATSRTSTVKREVAKTTKSQTTKEKHELNKSSGAPPSSTTQREDTKTAENQGTSEAQEIKKLTAAHPDWQEIIRTPEFRYWLDNVIPDGKALMASEDAEYISRRLSQFKKWKKAQNT